MKRKTPKIAEAEWLIMKILWKESPLAAREIIDRVKDASTWNPKTVKTLLNRLVKKSALGFDKEGRIYLYFPLVLEVDCARAERHSFLNKVYNGALQPMLAAFIEERAVSAAEIKELKRILDKIPKPDLVR